MKPIKMIKKKKKKKMGGVKDVRKVCQLMERCDGHGGDVKVLRVL